MTPHQVIQDESRPGRTQLQALTSLRFFAAFHVLLYHAGATFSASPVFHLPRPLANFLNTGYVGVSLFFLLSGFILAYNYLDDDLRHPNLRRKFWVSRLARIYPVYLIGLVIASPKYILGLLHPGFGPTALNASTASLSVLTLTQAWSPDLALAWNPPGWSLSAEAFFYLLFPLLAPWVNRLQTRKAAGLGATFSWLLAMLPVTAYYLAGADSPYWFNLLKFNPLARLPEFVMGLCLGKLFLADLQSATKPASATAVRSMLGPVILAILSILMAQDHIPKLMLHNGLLDPLFAVALLGLAWESRHPNRPNTPVLSHRGLVVLGQASYALYILHVPLKGLFAGGLELLPGQLLARPLTSSLMLSLYIGLSLAAALLTFKYFEIPARRAIKAKFAKCNADTPVRGLHQFIHQPTELEPPATRFLS